MAATYALLGNLNIDVDEIALEIGAQKDEVLHLFE